MLGGVTTELITGYLVQAPPQGGEPGPPHEVIDRTTSTVSSLRLQNLSPRLYSCTWRRGPGFLPVCQDQGVHAQ